jgi:hypothetical protein
MKIIPLTQRQVAIVDDEDFEFLNQSKWHAYWNDYTHSFYAIRHVWAAGKQKTLWMHRVILAYDRAALLHFGQFALLNFPAEAHLVS